MRLGLDNKKKNSPGVGSFQEQDAMENQLNNVNVVSKTILPTPADVRAELPMGGVS